MRLIGTIVIISMLIKTETLCYCHIFSKINFQLKKNSLFSSRSSSINSSGCSTCTRNRFARVGYLQASQIYKKKKKNYFLDAKKVNIHKMKMNDTDIDTGEEGVRSTEERVENQIEKCSQEISSLIERNESIRGIDDVELKKEYEKNQLLLDEKKKKLNLLFKIPSEPLKLAENRTKVENLAKRKLFYTNSFEIYGGSSGLIDYGPSGCLLKSELENLWRYHFIFYDEMLEMCGTCITPYNVLKTSGHVDRFTDLMIRDSVTNDFYRADKYISEYLTNKIEEKKKKKRMDHTQQFGDRAMKKKEHSDTISASAHGKEGDITHPGSGMATTDTKTDSEDPEVEEMGTIVRRLDGMNEQEIRDVIKKYDIKSPMKNNFVGPFPFNLMFQTKIGPKDTHVGDSIDDDVGSGRSTEVKPQEEKEFANVAYLRPETAQGIFVNFKKLLEYNGGKIPFAGAQIGLGFRNEISPRNGLLRVREFEMAEIEYFVNPNKKCHEKYYLFKHLVLPLYPRDKQLSSGTNNSSTILNITIEESVEKGIIQNEAMAYFLARTYLFLLKCGINKDGIRFRQHLETEMAHYANDCWDAEILTSYGFIEVVGHADRSAYDLKNHMKATGANLYACEKYDKPVEEEHVKITPNKAKIGSKFKNQQNLIYQWLSERMKDELLNIDEELDKKNSYIINISNGTSSNSLSFELTRDMISLQKYKKKVQEYSFIPNVIEPSFGIGRLIFCIMEHSFRTRTFMDDKEERHYLALPYILAPAKCSVLTISNNKMFIPFVKQVQMILNQYSISSKIDNSSVSIGKKYARTDEIGIPFAITIDFQTLKDKTITLRERDSMLQIRISFSNVAEIVTSLIRQNSTWSDYVSQYGLFTQQNLDT
ncbi:glycine--tRNA ligase [Plasmodium gonderi]|uniref:glycine--tRNA ligase n=1 Tax=Plasmodium gonderi TaxID=77519 RepID=A0A1Y1JP52_PLAGO|nr:glycine--tRNA ligase [Plasmodium gonderi]GAW83017.1 glycine--tRNA ligase [Plasmodium gonderi]